MKTLSFIFALIFSMYNFSIAQIVGNRLEIGQNYTFESVSAPGMFISYGTTQGRAALNAKNKKFKVVAPLNGRKGFVSFQAVNLTGDVYLVMAEVCPRPYTASHYYNVTAAPTTKDVAFNENASFEVLTGNSNRQDASLVSFRVKNGTHFLKREQGVFMNAPGGGVAPRYQTHFTWKLDKTVGPAPTPTITPTVAATPSIVSTWTFDTGGNGLATIVFNANNTGEISIAGSSETFTYTKPDSKTLIITPAGSAAETNEIVSLTVTTMVIKDNSGNAITLTRK